jgi:hypothetical protein
MQFKKATLQGVAVGHEVFSQQGDQIGRIVYVGHIFKIKKVVFPHLWATFFRCHGYALTLKKMAWAIFSQTHLATLFRIWKAAKNV